MSQPAGDRSPRVCLTMIVRDAAAFIEDTLSSVAPFVESWNVVDTGSIDDTPNVVERFFEQIGLPGTLYHRPWQSFSHNRTEALELSRGTADYAWMVDADDVLRGTPDLGGLHHDCYSTRFGTDFTFWRQAIFRLDRAWEYRGVVHEYPVCTDGPTTTGNVGGDYWIEFRSLGTRGTDPMRFKRDIEALTAALADDPDDPRTVFYLAQSYRDAGQPADALRWYRTRQAMAGWDEERFVAAYEVGRCLEQLERPTDEVVEAYLEAWLSRPSRAEPLNAIARRHRIDGNWRAGYLAACRAESIPHPDDALFVQSDTYRWRSTDERSICAHYLGLHDEAVDVCNRLLASPDVPLDERARILANRSYALAAIDDRRSPYRPDIVTSLTESMKSPRADPQVTLTITTCRRPELFEQTIDSFLDCCTDIDAVDRWICIDDGSSEADRRAMQHRYPFFEFIFKSADERGHARSMNRLLQEVTTPYWLHLEDDWRFVARDDYVARTRAVLDDGDAYLQVMLNRNYAETLDDHQLMGGELLRTGDRSTVYRLHRYQPQGSQELADLLRDHAGRLTNAHWPGFSLAPSMIATSRLKANGAFNPGSSFFEYDFAMKAVGAGYQVASLDTISGIHIGRLRQDQRPNPPASAYELNGHRQWVTQHPETVVALHTNWTTGAELARLWDRQFPSEGSWHGVRLELEPTDPSEAEVVVIVNSTSEPAPPARTILMCMEPSAAEPTLSTWATAAANPNPYLQVRTRDVVPNTIEWHLAMSYDDLWTTEIVKSRGLSAVTSSKRISPGHHLRLDFLHHLEKQRVPVDIFGYDNHDRFDGYRGPLPAFDKRDGLLPYRYTIAVENHAETNYMTEKLTDAILAECLCFYWGADNAEDVFGPDAFIRLPLDDFERATGLVEAAMLSNEYERRRPAILSAKRKILDDLQLAPTLARTIRGRSLADDLDIHVINLDRRPDRLERFERHVIEMAGAAFLERCVRFPAVDGRTLERSAELDRMFRGGQRPLRRSTTACALSHLALWSEVADGDGRPALILEDDVTFAGSFTARLVEVCGRMLERGDDLDVVLLGLTLDEAVPPPQSAHQQLRRADLNGVIGGAFAYVVTQRGARRLLEHASEGIFTAIDTFLLNLASTTDDFVILQAVPALVTTPVARPVGPIIDSDIQYDHTTL